MSDLFAPNNPNVTRAHRGIVWTAAMKGALDTYLRNAEGVHRLLKMFQGLSATGCEQWLCLDSQTPLPNQDAVLSMLKSIGVNCSTPSQYGSILAEVTRPEGVVIAALLHLSMEVTEPLGLKVAPQDLEFAEQGSSFILPSPARVFQVDKPVPRDGRIRRLMLAVHEAESRGNGVDMAWKELNQAIPFYFLQGPMGRFSNALAWYWKRDPGFMDELSLTMTASDLGSRNYAAAQMSVAQLGKFLLQINVPPVLNAYMIRGKPFFFFRRIDHSQTIATGADFAAQ